MFRWLALLLMLFELAGATAAVARMALAPVILISIDGFRADYLDRGITPNLSALAAAGARGAMRPSFPSKTYPNHYTLVTGLRPDHHGLVDNNFTDPALGGATFKVSDRDAVRDRRWWDEAEPVWVTAERAGIITAPMYWPGAEAAIHGVRPTYSPVYDQTTPPPARVDQILAWLDLPPQRRPRFLTLYFDDVDTAGHDFGPDAKETDAAVAKVDAAVGRLRDGLKARGVAADLVVVADHGMAAIDARRTIWMHDLLPADSYRTLTLGAFATVYPQPGHHAQVARALTAPHPHLHCWRRAQIPARYHYGQNPRVAPIFCLPDTGWEIRETAPDEPRGGDHGFDPYSPQMAAIFIANGPDIRPAVRLPTFDNVSVYPLLMRLLALKPRPNDGRLADTAPALAP